MRTTAKPDRRVTVEVVVDSVAGALTAQRAGADRLELCCALAEGGLTPSLGMVQSVAATVRLPILAMLRPRAGDFLYAADEFAVLRADLDHFAAAGVAGFATAVLTADGDLDVSRLRELVAAASPLPITCHRAFDLVRDPMAALEQLIDLGVARVLTSGQQRTAVDGCGSIAALVERSRGRIAAIAGAGVRAHNVRALVRSTGVREVHLSASRFEPSAMRHRNPAATMATQAPAGDFSLRQTDGDEVAAVVAAANDAGDG